MSAPGNRNIAKFGLATAVALSPMVAGEAQATAVQSDSLQLGTHTALTIPENGSEPASVQDSITVSEGTSNITGTAVITLTEPGSTAISDIVTAQLTGFEGVFTLTVTLQSDGET